MDVGKWTRIPGLRWLGRMRDRGLFVGGGYACFVTLGLMTTWYLDGFFYNWVEHDLATAFREAGFFWLIMMVHQLPTVPLLTAGINSAPESGVRRYTWLALVGVGMWGFCTLFFTIEDRSFVPNLQYALMVAFILAACVYRSSARTASTRLMQQQIESAALGADVKQARLQLLRAQIEPHFLFNTLATVRTLARVDRPAAIEMLDHLMRYFSEALPKLRQDESALADEINLIDAYLRIHQIRMGARLTYELTVPEQLAVERIPTMLLLTLVENAVKHGINPALDGGSICVSASRELNNLVLKVSDSGKGLSVTDGHGTGLANLRRRLSILYGENAVLSLAPAATRGVVATVYIPLAAA
jgi:Histidine kinase